MRGRNVGDDNDDDDDDNGDEDDDDDDEEEEVLPRGKKMYNGPRTIFQLTDGELDDDKPQGFRSDIERHAEMEREDESEEEEKDEDDMAKDIMGGDGDIEVKLNVFRQMMERRGFDLETQRSKLARARKTREAFERARGHGFAGGKRKVTNHLKSDPSTVTAHSRKRSYPTEPFIVEAGVLYCQCCSTQLALKKFSIDKHIEGNKRQKADPSFVSDHDDRKKKWMRGNAEKDRLSRVAVTAAAAPTYNKTTGLETTKYRLSVTYALLLSHTPFAVMDDQDPRGLRALLEGGRHNLPYNGQGGGPHPPLVCHCRARLLPADAALR